MFKRALGRYHSSSAEFDERQLSLILDAQANRPRRAHVTRGPSANKRFEKEPVTAPTQAIEEVLEPQERPSDFPAHSASDKILRLPAVKAATGLGRTAIYEGMAEGTFPRARKIGARAVGWSASDIQRWLDARPRVGA